MRIEVQAHIGEQQKDLDKITYMVIGRIGCIG
jgi:hypothetical protein